MNHEIAEAIKNVNMYEIAQKTEYKASALNDDEKLVVSQLDAHFKKIGETGEDPGREIAAFIKKVIEEEIYNTPDEILDLIFNRGTVGEFDDYEATIVAKNKLEAYEAAKGGNVEKSFLDISVLKPVWRHLQVESSISYTDLRKNGWKSVATITNFAVETLKNKMFKIVFDVVDSGIVNGAENYINESTAKPTQATMDAMALYVNDRANGQGVITGLSKYIQAASKLTGFVSDEMRNEVHRTGRLGSYDGVTLAGISSAHKLADGSTQIMDKRLFGIAGKIGELDMKGDVRILETMDNNDEKVDIKITGFEFGYALNPDTLEKVCKAVMA